MTNVYNDAARRVYEQSGSSALRERLETERWIGRKREIERESDEMVSGWGEG